MTAPRTTVEGESTLQERARKAAEGIVAHPGEVYGATLAYLAAAKAEVIRELEALVPKVCMSCDLGESLVAPGFHAGTWAPYACHAAPLHARIAELRKGEGT